MENILNFTIASKTSYKKLKLFSAVAIFIAIFAFLFGTKLVESLLLPLISTDNFRISYLPLEFNKNTFFEVIIAFINIGFAIVVLTDLCFIRPISRINNSLPVNKSFNQFIFGWKMLWVGWILLYSCLALGWLGFHYFYLNFLSNAFNILNGFFFYYLFFVLDTFSVKTEKDVKRSDGFKFSITITAIIGLLVLVLPTLVPEHLLSDSKNDLFILNLAAAYTAVGMVFFFGRLDSHYLNLSRLVLAPLYLYAVIQLFWISDIFNTDKPSANRIVIFTVAFVLKIGIFYLISKEIRQGVFYRYMQDAVNGLEKKRKFEIALNEVKENESFLSVYIQTKNNLEVIVTKLNALNSIYSELCKLLNISIIERHLKVISIESGSLRLWLFGDREILKFIIDLINRAINFKFVTGTKLGRMEQLREQVKQTLITKKMLNAEGIKTNEMDKLLEESGTKIARNLLDFIDDEKNVKADEKTFSNGSIVYKVISDGGERDYDDFPFA